nr:Chain G, Protein E6 [Human papillomavirus 16]6HKS_H Chain H, Protein E6 [Human papillomavirus 16]6HKS_I Chain I, Protein E6 [Human papillomavirus 16]6HKS_J Chain J, Protein E6 [Human papillomavirus 16]6HKS_K Chain K, Protein E6 [Human papillomavirus 16]6HKS_L Chain L, Protein E6 [Human papillomavirus 16]
RSSRTRRETQL